MHKTLLCVQCSRGISKKYKCDCVYWTNVWSHKSIFFLTSSNYPEFLLSFTYTITSSSTYFIIFDHIIQYRQYHRTLFVCYAKFLHQRIPKRKKKKRLRAWFGYTDIIQNVSIRKTQKSIKENILGWYLNKYSCKMLCFKTIEKREILFFSF